ncbi:MAG: prepilin-type N-terminal cleavage/methylation domain-containing protein, partial [Akkermansiaceae bacterium]
MQTSSYTRSKLRGGFTLIEVLTVIAIIAVLATMSVTGFQWYQRKAKIGRAQVFLKSVERALEEYRTDTGVFPQGNGNSGSTSEVYEALYGDSDGDGKTDDGASALLSTLDPNLPRKQQNVREEGGTYVMVDPWGEEYLY